MLSVLHSDQLVKYTFRPQNKLAKLFRLNLKRDSEFSSFIGELNSKRKRRGKKSYSVTSLSLVQFHLNKIAVISRLNENRGRKQVVRLSDRLYSTKISHSFVIIL